MPKILLVLALFCNISAFAADNLTKTLAVQFAKIWHAAPQEKLYLHTDKAYYSAGETIWFSAYLLNAATHLPNAQSRYIYVELIDAGDSPVQRVKIRKDSVSFSGHLVLPPETPPGFYSLRAYTFYMQNAGANFFFKKQIFIGNSIDDRINCKADFGEKSVKNLPLTLSFTNAYDTPIPEMDLEIQYSWDKKGKIYTHHSDDDGKVKLNLPNDSVSGEKRFITVKIKRENANFERNIFLPSTKKDFDLQFFPESGTFLNNDIQTLGFKAVGNDGFSVDVSGIIFNNRDEKIAEFSSVHRGMGLVSLKTLPEESYYAVAKIGDGTEKRFKLPETQSVGISMQVSYYRQNVTFNIINQTEKPTDSLFLLIHSRGVLITAFPLKNLQGILPENLLPAGINSFSIVDSLGNTYCERLYFSRNFKTTNIEMKTDKNAYSQHENVELKFNISGENGKTADGIFSVSITDRRTVAPDTVGTNIINYFLLQSDLRGYIENPAEYFADNSNTTRAKTDILMLTQGWRRFSTADVVANRFPKNDFYLEIGQTLSGKVKNIFGKGAKKHSVIMFSMYKNRIATAETDDEGKFVIDGIEFPDSTKIILKAKSKSFADVELVPDAELFPDTRFDFPLQTEKDEVVAPPDYLQISKEKYYAESGMRLINLKEVSVTAKKKRDATEQYYASLASREITAEQIEQWAGLSILDVLGTIAGIQVNGSEVTIRGVPPLFLIDEIEVSNSEDVYYLNPSDVKSIFVYKGIEASMMFGNRAGNGAIAIFLKRGEERTAETPISLVHISPLGYQKPVEFYVPKYGIDSIFRQHTPDLRTTVYWNASLQTDSSGQIKVNFFTADKPHDYDVILEGITADGIICRYKGILNRKQ